MSDIRKQYSESKLDAEKIELLKAVDFSFEEPDFDSDEMKKLADEQWEENFGPMVAFYEEHGHCDVEDENPKLARWFLAMQGHKQKGNAQLSPGRQHLIQRFLKNERVQCNTQQCEKYALFNGHCRVHSAAMPVHEATPPAKKRAVGRILGGNEEFWEKQYACLVEFRKSTGHCNVLRGHNREECVSVLSMIVRHNLCESPHLQLLYSLRTWIQRQRERYRANKLSEERIQRMNLLDFPWEAPREGNNFDELYEKLVAFHEIHGNCNVLKSHNKPR